MCDKAKKNAVDKIKNNIKTIAANPTVDNVNKYNSVVLGLHNYYKIATLVNLDFVDIAFTVNKSLDCRTKNIRNKHGTITSTYLKFYGQYNWKKRFIANMILFPIAGIKFTMPRIFPKDWNRYTPEGRLFIHQRLKMDMHTVYYLLENSNQNKSVEFNDNRISLFIAQQGKCQVSGENLSKDNMEVHHVTPLSLGGNDNYKNLVIVTKETHKLIHATRRETIFHYLPSVLKKERSLEKLNKLRALAGNSEIETNYC